jgi:hypothetical protein
VTWPCPHEKARAVCPDCGATVSAASSVSAGSVKALIADASEPFLVPDVTPRGASKAAVFHMLRDMVDAGALEHHVDGYRRPNAVASAGTGQVPADTIEQAYKALTVARTWIVADSTSSSRRWKPKVQKARALVDEALDALAVVRTPEEQT